MAGLLTIGVFPLVFVGAMVATVFGLDAGWEEGVVVLVISASAALIIGVLERVHPHIEQWNSPRGDISADGLHLIFSMALVPELIKAGTFTALYAVGAWLSVQVGMGLWPSSLSLFWQCVLGMVIAEFGSYWAHRLMHEWPLLWRLHATHHSPHRLYWLNAARFHPLDTALQYFGHTIPLALMGCPAEVLVIFTVFTSVHGMFQHANIRMRLGPLNWVFSMAELHRWHHSTLVEEGNTNYGANLIVWDIVFGTRFLPADREPPATIGIGNLPNFPRTWWAHVVSPFRWERTVAISGGRGEGSDV